MSTYYNAAEKNINISEMDLPKFVKQYLTYLLIELNLSPQTVFDYSVSIRTFLRWFRSIESGSSNESFHSIDVSSVTPEQISSLDRSDIYEFLSFCHAQLDNSASSRAAKLIAVRSMYDYLSTKSSYKNIFLSNPAADIATPKKENKLPVYLTIDEVKKILNAIEGSKTYFRDYCMIFWMVSCGMRLSELVGINLSDIKDDNLRIRGKERKERIIPLNESCKIVLENYLLERAGYKRKSETEDALFLSPQTGKRLTGRRVEQILDQYLLKAGLSTNGYSPHKLRHTAATILYGQGTGLLELKTLLGHSSTQTTELYSHLSPTATKKALDESPLNILKSSE